MSPGDSSVPAKRLPSITADAPAAMRLRDVARVANAAIGDHRNVLRGHAVERILDRGDLRHADAGDDARRADRAGPDADLHAVGAVIGERLRAVGGRDVAADHLHLRIALLDPSHAIEHTLRMTVRRVDDDDVDAGRDERLDALVGVAAGADGGADAQAPELVLAGERVLGRLQDVLDGDEPAQFVRRVDDEHALETVAVHQRLRVLEIGAFGNGDELVALAS